MTHARTKPRAQQRTYGVLVGTIRDGQEDPSGRSPHYEIWVQADRDYRIAVNVRSVDGSEVVAYYDPKFTNPTKLDLPRLAAGPSGFTKLTTGPGGDGLDYLRDDLFPLDAMAPIPSEGQGVTLSNLLDGQIERAKADEASVVVAFGQFFEDRGSDHAFWLFTRTRCSRHSYDARQHRKLRGRQQNQWRRCAVYPVFGERDDCIVHPVQRAIDDNGQQRQSGLALTRAVSGISGRLLTAKALKPPACCMVRPGKESVHPRSNSAGAGRVGRDDHG